MPKTKTRQNFVSDVHSSRNIMPERFLTDALNVHLRQSLLSQSKTQQNDLKRFLDNHKQLSLSDIAAEAAAEILNPGRPNPK